MPTLAFCVGKDYYSTTFAKQLFGIFKCQLVKNHQNKLTAVLTRG